MVTAVGIRCSSGVSDAPKPEDTDVKMSMVPQQSERDQRLVMKHLTTPAKQSHWYLFKSDTCGHCERLSQEGIPEHIVSVDVNTLWFVILADPHNRDHVAVASHLNDIRVPCLKYIPTGKTVTTSPHPYIMVDGPMHLRQVTAKG